MNKQMYVLRLALTFFVAVIVINPSKAQSHNDSDDLQKLSNEILHHDSLFWQAYNACDVDKMGTFFTEDLEFYHDKGGLTSGLSQFTKSVRDGLCGGKGWSLRREVVEGSLGLYPLNNYGAILTGEHVFYLTEEGKKERLDGIAKFTHVWHYKNNEWKMSRVLSYDHGPAPGTKKDKVSLSNEVLMQYAGEYEASKNRTIIIGQGENFLTLKDGKFETNIYPESENMFFLKERDIKFEFIKDNQEGMKMIVRENGEVVEEANKIK